MKRWMLVTGTSAVLMTGMLVPSAQATSPDASNTNQVSASAVLSPRKKARGTLKIKVTGTGTYSVTGKHFRKTSSASKSFRVKPGIYKVRAKNARISARKAVVKRGRTTRVRVAFRAPSQSAPTPVPAPIPAVPSPETPAVSQVHLTRVVDMQPGTTTRIETTPELAEVTESVGHGSDGPMSWIIQDGQLMLAAAHDASLGSRTIQVGALGCVQPDSCGHRALVTVEVQIRGLVAPHGQMLESLTEPSPDRIAEASSLAGGSALQLPDEVTVVLGTAESPGGRAMADRVADSVGAVVVGGLEAAGIYQLRWTSPQDIDAQIAALRLDPDVDGVDRGLLITDPDASVGSSDPPTEMARPSHTWQLRQMRAPQAWQVTTGADVPVGIADSWVVDDHPELNIRYRDTRFAPPTTKDGGLGHATHVAGLACARANQGETVGVAWGCPIISSAAVPVPKWNPDMAAQSLSSAVTAINVVVLGGAKVVNVSLGWNPHNWLHTGGCLTQEQSDQMASQYGLTVNHTTSNQFRRLAKRSDAVFTVSAGNNCSPAGGSPFTPADNLDNVISVAAVNSSGNLAAFSNWDAEVAAGGGALVGGAGGVWSTLPDGTYGVMAGTSQAAPLVAGEAALVRSAHPDLDAREVGRCITRTAGTNTGTATRRDDNLPGGFSPKIAYTKSVPIVDAEAAVNCEAQPPGRAPGAIQRVSTAADGGQSVGGFGSVYAVWSPDGSKIAFYSEASNLVPGDTNGQGDVFVKSLSSGAIQRVSTAADGGQGNYPSGGGRGPVWSPDGSKIAFHSAATNLVPGDFSNGSDIFVKTLSSGELQRISTDAADGQANAGSYDPEWSPDGSKIAFSSEASNLVAGDTNRSSDVFVKTLSSGAIQRVSTAADGGQSVGGFGSFFAVWSPDGSKIAFYSEASNLVAGDTNRSSDVFVKTLSSGAVQRVSIAADGTEGNGYSYEPAWSPDGSRIAFGSQASNLVAGETNGNTHVFVKTLSSGAIRQVSTAADGTEGNSSSRAAAWSPDGSRIAFYSQASNLVAGETNGNVHVFVKTLSSGAIRQVSTAADGTEGNGYSYEPAWSPDGSRIAFYSQASNLVAGDTNGVADVFVKTLG